MFEQGGIKTKDVAASLSGSAVIVKKITLPLMTDAELAESIYWEAEQYIPFDTQDVNLDYQVTEAGDAEGRGTMEVLLGAAKKEKIADYTAVISQAGRVPVVVDVDTFALQNAYEANYGVHPDEVVVLLNAGASAININILTAAQSVFTRDISPQDPDAGDTVSFDASPPSIGGAGHTIASYAWSFGDASSAGNLVAPTNTYASEGVYTVSLTVTDNLGASVTQRQAVVVGELTPPTAAIVFSIAGTVVNFEGTTSTTEPGRTITGYTWNFGDNTTGTGATIQHDYVGAASGTTFNPTLTVTDSAGLTGSATASVVIP